MNPRSAAQAHQVRRIKPVSSGPPEVGDLGDINLNLDPRFSKDRQPFACYRGKGIQHGGNDPSNASAKDRVGARRRLAVMAARLEGHVERGPERLFSGAIQRVHFSMSLPVLFVPAFSNDTAIANDDGANERVGLDMPAAAFGEFEGAQNVIVIGHKKSRNQVNHSLPIASMPMYARITTPSKQSTRTRTAMLFLRESLKCERFGYAEVLDLGLDSA
jgi:hypothetical protein